MGYKDNTFLEKMMGLIVAFLIAQIGIIDIRGQELTELYLVSGYPTDDSEMNVPARLYRLSREDRSLTVVEELLKETETTDFIRAYHDKRLLIAAAPHYYPQHLIIVNMNDPCKTGHVDIESEKWNPSRIFLLDIPGEGLFLAFEGYSRELKQNQFYSINLRTGREKALDPDVLKYACIPGLSGVGHLDTYSMDLFIDPKGYLQKPWYDETGNRLINIDLPPMPYNALPLKKTGIWSVNGIEQTMWSVMWMIGTERFDLIFPREDSGEAKKQVFQLFDKSEKTWKEVKVPGVFPKGFTQLKPFGNWMAGIPVGELVQGSEKEKEAINKARKEKRNSGLRFLRLLYRNPNEEIFLYNVKTGKDYTIKTDDIESEVLLVEDDVVYYRVKDRLYRSDISKDFKDPELLAQDPALEGIYWAFFGPPCKGTTD